MSGGRYRDTYRFNLGSGLDTVIEPSGVAAGYNDTLIFGAGIAPTDITVVRSGNHLLFKHANGVVQVTVANWFASSNYWLETVEFADGTAWTSSALTAAALVFSGTAGNDVLTGTVRNDTLLGRPATTPSALGRHQHHGRRATATTSSPAPPTTTTGRPTPCWAARATTP